jgi:O-methyltransferase involved in polyketide biosynthesis
LLAEAGIDVPPTLTFVAADFERDDLSGTLRQAGFRADLAVCVSWIGVSMYLTDDAVSATIRTVAGFAAGSCLCLNYRVPLTMLDPIEQAISEVMEMRVAAMGEPWLSAFEPAQLQKQLLELGFSSAEVPRRKNSTRAISPDARTGCAPEAVSACCARARDALPQAVRLMYCPVLAGGGLGGGVDSTTALICACWVLCCH